MTHVEYNNIVKEYGNERAVDGIDLAVNEGEFIVIVGPSGCGKTTTLHCLAGLVEPTAGKIKINGKDVTNLHPKDRDIAMVFQNLALYPHMNVKENIGYPLKTAGISPDERTSQIREVAELLEIPGLLNRSIDEISGGQKQRVAIGRALVRRPDVFLMDEPLASLDAKLKVEMRNRIKVLQRELGITTVYVTHDQEEAMTLADKIAVMHNGHVSQFGTPTEIYHDPANKFIAEFIGSPSMNLLTVVRDDDDPQRVRAKTDPESFALMLDSKFSDSRKQIDRFDLGIRPQYFQVHTEPTDEGVSCVVEVTQPTGDEQLLTVYTGSGLDGSGIELTVKTASERSIDHGQQLWLTVDPDEVYRFDPETGERIKPEGETPEAPLENTMIDAQ